jgi:hypothetical protein
MCSYIPKCNERCVRGNYYYNLLSFKVCICEIIYNAVRLFPDIQEYTITVKNYETTVLKIGFFPDLDEEGERCLAIISNSLGDFALTKQNLHDLYVANRTTEQNKETIHALMAMLYLDGTYPTITTSYINLPGKSKN